MQRNCFHLMLRSCPIRVTVIASFHLVKTVYVNIQVTIITETLKQIQLSPLCYLSGVSVSLNENMDASHQPKGTLRTTNSFLITQETGTLYGDKFRAWLLPKKVPGHVSGDFPLWASRTASICFFLGLLHPSSYNFSPVYCNIVHFL